jgi:hypothetical protein
MNVEELPDLEHEFETLTGPEHVMMDGHKDPPRPTGNGVAECVRCGLRLPAQDGRIDEDWVIYVKGINCAERLLQHVYQL